MPKVGNKRYPYTPAGEKAAAAEAKRSGKKIQKTKPKKNG